MSVTTLPSQDYHTSAFVDDENSFGPCCLLDVAQECFWAPDLDPAEIPPGRQISGPEALSWPLAGNFNFLRGGKSVILALWAAPGALETLQKVWGLRPPSFLKSR